VPKRIPCTVVKTKLLCPVGDWFVAKPWYEPCHSVPPAPTGPSLAHKPVGNVDKLFAGFTRQSLILDYYA
jgi:hypothetical protein